jgi:CDP-diacylglycerol--glycerol-3-phosphate 3-phosphatidyltransferase
MTLPLLLTFTRLFVSITLLPFLIFFLFPLQTNSVGIFLAAVVSFLSATDFFDGYYARRYNQETVLGRLLDPLADKCLIIGILIPLLALHKIYFYWVLFIITRELLVTGLRHIADSYNFSIPVSRWGKWKAFFQYCYVIFVVGSPWTTNLFSFKQSEMLLLSLMIIFSIVSGLLYCHQFIKQWQLLSDTK